MAGRSRGKTDAASDFSTKLFGELFIRTDCTQEHNKMSFNWMKWGAPPEAASSIATPSPARPETPHPDKTRVINRNNNPHKTFARTLPCSFAPRSHTLPLRTTLLPTQAIGKDLVRILTEGVSQHQLCYNADLSTYTGFTQFSQLTSNGRHSCVPMNGNRAVDKAVVQQRVADNVRRLNNGEALADFGQIALVVIENGPADWMVMDGQHRLAAMKKLSARGVDVWFQFRVKVVATEDVAHAELLLFQDQFPPDPRSFLPDRHQTALAGAVVDALRVKFSHPSLWVAPAASRPRPGARIGDPSRPFLSDNIVLGFLAQSGLLAPQGLSSSSTRPAKRPRKNANTFKREVEMLTQSVLAANSVLAKMGVGRLGQDATRTMISRATEMGCFLGFLREGKLNWIDLADEIAAQMPPEIGETQSTKAASEDVSHVVSGDHFCCPLTLDVMANPVIAADGHTYERSAIEEWFKNNDTSPITNLLVASTVLTPNFALKSMLKQGTSTVSEASIQNLVGMGFDRQQAQLALESTGGDLSLAASQLLSS